MFPFIQMMLHEVAGFVHGADFAFRGTETAKGQTQADDKYLEAC